MSIHAGHLSTTDLRELIDEADPLTIGHCAAILAAARRVRDLGPLPPAPELPDYAQDDPFTHQSLIGAHDEQHRKARLAQREAQIRSAGDLSLPLNWGLSHDPDGITYVQRFLVDLHHQVDPDAAPEALLSDLHATVTAIAANAATFWRAQAADLLARADLAAQLPAAIITEPTP